MRRKLASLIESPIQDQDLAQQARILHTMLLTSGVLLCIAAIVTISLFTIEPASYGLGPTLIVLLVMLITAASYTWSRRGHVHAAVYLFLAGVILGTTISLLLRGTSSATVLVYAFTVVTAGLLIRPSSALIFALLNTALFASISAWQLLEPLPRPMDRPSNLSMKSPS